MSRAFGNRLLKQFVVAEPEIQVHREALKPFYLVLFHISCNLGFSVF